MNASTLSAAGRVSDLRAKFESTDYAWIDKLTASELPEVRPLAVLGSVGRSTRKLAGGSIRPRQGDLVPFEFAGFANHAANWRTALGLIDARLARLAGTSATMAAPARITTQPPKPAAAPAKSKALVGLERVVAAMNFELAASKNSKSTR